MDEPLIFTSRGNVPVASLKQVVMWQETPEATVFIEEYHAEDGEVVKRSVHGRTKQGIGAIGAQPIL